MQEIFHLFYKTKSVFIRNILVEMNLGLARKIAHQMAAKCSEVYEELEAWAIAGLLKAVERYNPEHSRFFSSFALPGIRGEILHYLRDRASTIRIPRKLQEKSTAKGKVETQLAIKLGRQPTAREIMEGLSIDPTTYSELDVASDNRRSLLSLDARLRNTDDVLLGDLLAAKQLPNYQDDLLAQLEQAVLQIPCDRTREIVMLIYIKGIAPADVGQLLGITLTELCEYAEAGVYQLVGKVDINFESLVQMVVDWGAEEIWKLAQIGLCPLPREEDGFYAYLRQG